MSALSLIPIKILYFALSHAVFMSTFFYFKNEQKDNLCQRNNKTWNRLSAQYDTSRQRNIFHSLYNF